jgi:hypothetical protein
MSFSKVMTPCKLKLNCAFSQLSGVSQAAFLAASSLFIDSSPTEDAHRPCSGLKFSTNKLSAFKDPISCFERAIYINQRYENLQNP